MIPPEILVHPLHTSRRTLDNGAGLACFDRPGTSHGPTEATNGRLEHLRGSALGFRNPVVTLADEPDLAWLIHHPSVVVIPGASSVPQVEVDGQLPRSPNGRRVLRAHAAGPSFPPTGLRAT